MSNYTDGVIEITYGTEKVKATLTDSGWVCDNSAVLQWLMDFFPYPENTFISFSPLDPNPPYVLMSQVVGALGARFIQKPESTLPPDTIY